MKKAFCAFLFYRVMGWTSRVTVPDYDKYVLCAVPHTSNWDLLIGKIFCGAIGRRICFLMKREWFVWPLSRVFRKMGGIPVDRKHNTSLVDQIVREAKERKSFHVAITPEGTRSANPDWKTGFYYIALNAQIPIVLAAIDYKAKCIIVEREFFPSGDIDRDMQEIKSYYIQFQGKHPERFSTGMADIR